MSIVHVAALIVLLVACGKPRHMTVEAVARSVLERFPVYEFRSRNVKEVTAQHVLRSVVVRDGRIHAELGLPF